MRVANLYYEFCAWDPSRKVPVTMKLPPLYTIAAILLLPSILSAAEPIHVGNFSSGDLSGWSDKIFKGKTTYTLVREGERLVLKAHSLNAASGLIRKISADPKRFPLLRWSWKVENVIRKEDITRKEGDDFSARVYVVFPRSFWRMRAINYVWSAKLPAGSSAPSPYTGNSKVVAVESGREKLGTWVNEERNIFEDYRKLFGEDPPEIGAVAIMTDTDDTHEEATAYYGDIFLSPEKREENGSRPATPLQPATAPAPSPELHLPAPLPPSLPPPAKAPEPMPPSSPEKPANDSKGKLN
jgi:hypothetical protein